MVTMNSLWDDVAETLRRAVILLIGFGIISILYAFVTVMIIVPNATLLPIFFLITWYLRGDPVTRDLA